MFSIMPCFKFSLTDTNAINTVTNQGWSPLLPAPLSPVLRKGFRLSLPIRGGEGLYFACLGPRAARSGACPGLQSVAPTGPKASARAAFQHPRCSAKKIWDTLSLVKGDSRGFVQQDLRPPPRPAPYQGSQDWISSHLHWFSGLHHPDEIVILIWVPWSQARESLAFSSKPQRSFYSILNNIDNILTNCLFFYLYVSLFRKWFIFY